MLAWQLPIKEPYDAGNGCGTQCFGQFIHIDYLKLIFIGYIQQTWFQISCNHRQNDAPVAYSAINRYLLRSY